MTDRFSERLSEYLDDDLMPGERLEVERHLLDCAACRAELDGLRHVVRDAAALVDTPPARDLWLDVRKSLPIPARRRLITMSIPQAVAAGVFLAIASGAGVGLFFDRQRRAEIGPASGRATTAPAAIPVGLTGSGYDRAVEDLMRLLAEERSRLSAKTIEALQRNLATIDRAISEARAAVERDPADPFLTSHLAQQRRAKLELLRTANQRARAGL